MKDMTESNRTNQPHATPYYEQTTLPNRSLRAFPHLRKPFFLSGSFYQTK